MLDKESLAKLVEIQKSVVARARKAQTASTPPTAQKLTRTVEQKPAPETAAHRPVPKSADEAGTDSDAQAAQEAARAAIVDVPRSGPTAEIDARLAAAAAEGASDVHFHSRARPRVRLRGQLIEKDEPELSPEKAASLILPMLSEEDRATFEEHGELDFSYSLDGVGRFRTNVYRQLRGIDATMRRISPTPPTLESLNLPSALAKFTNFHQGMVLLTGPTSCGKSSTMAALVNMVNEERAEHILTIEDPIEYLHESKRCLVNQRNVKRHTESFARALRAALREDPDVIVIGELRDRETVSLAMTAAETGHFVLATLHTDNAIRTVNRIVGSFPPDQQEQVRSMLSESLRAVISQRLVPTVDGQAQVPATEVMVVNRAVGNLIRENKTVQIRSLMQTGLAQGMNLLDTSLSELLKNGTISREAALECCEDPKNIEA
ncbi:MAG: type IV pilus twitching motility protein PilT [bacterium]|nr:type IV pilus twitching motility protein PilT [bacterium]